MNNKQDFSEILFNPIFNPSVERSFITDTLTRSLIEDSDETESNLSLKYHQKSDNPGNNESSNIFSMHSVSIIIIDKESQLCESLMYSNNTSSQSLDMYNGNKDTNINNHYKVLGRTILTTASKNNYGPNDKIVKGKCSTLIKE